MVTPGKQSSRRGRIWQGLRATLPIALSVVPFGIAYGAVASRSLAGWQAALMSLAVFAGTAQFVSVSLLAQGMQHLPILLTGVLINLRLVLMSAAITPHIRRAPRAMYPVMAQLLTDETFAVSMAAYERGLDDPLYFVGSGLALYGTWQLATWVGLAFGSAIPTNLGLEYALSGSLICLLFLLVRERRGAAVAVLAAALSLALRPLVSGTWSTMVATLSAVTLGVIWKRWPSRS
jgi:4-azaleucine resistance transporter AzlC